MNRLKTCIALIALGLLCVSCGGSGASAQPGFSLASLRGSYAAQFVGEVNAGAQLGTITGTGVFISDGAGHLSGDQSYVVATTPCEATIKGTYTVNPDGTGTNAITYTTTTPGCTSGSYTQNFAIGDSNKLVLLTDTNGNQVSEEWHLQ